ncbi:hypothetical protein TNCV_3213441 [Trichonephila clavipes]|nr:hypothetical protein TNCV_3213441 [Trichonephila clavipes]
MISRDPPGSWERNPTARARNDRCCARSRNAYHPVSDYDKGRIVAYRYCDLSYRSITVRVVRDLMTVNRRGNLWVQNCCRVVVLDLTAPITRSRKDKHVSRMDLMDCATTS